jgi:tetratricopeptide (TPR) repeat protein
VKSRASSARDRTHQAAAVLSIVGATFVAFAPSLSGGFLNYDDGVNFVQNPHYRGLALENLRWMFGHVAGHYQPVTWLSHGVDYVLWGMNPFGYRAANLALHCGGALLLYGLLLELLPRVRALTNARGTPSLHWACASGAALFAVHPLRVESVAWITERRDVLFLFFALASILLYVRAQSETVTSRTRRLGLAASVLLFALSIFSKAMSMTLPVLLLLLDAWPLGRLRGLSDLLPRIREKSAFFAVMLAGIVMEVIAEARDGSLDLDSGPGSDYGIGDVLSQPAYRLAFYWWKTLVPTDLMAVYPLPADRDPTAPVFLLCALGALLLTAALAVTARRTPALLVTWLAFALMLSPTLGLVHVSYHFAADRNTYFASTAPAALVAGGLARLWISRGPPALKITTAFASAALVVACIGATRAQSRVWTSSQRLWEHAVAVDPENHIAQYNLGHLLAEQGEYSRAVDHYSRAIWAQEDLTKAYYNRALAWLAQGQLERGIRDLDRTLELDPEHWLAWSNRGSARLDVGDVSGAISDLSRAIELQPQRPRLWEARARARQRAGDEAGARADLERSRAQR